MSLTSWIIPALLLLSALYAVRRKVDVYDALISGAGNGLGLAARILPSMVALLCTVSMLRASGATEWLANLLSPVLRLFGLPPEVTPLMLIRPMSGSGALAVGSELMAQYGPDSYIGRVAAVMLGSTETTFYTIALYFGAADIRRTRYTIPAALTADLAAFVFAALSVRWLMR